MRTYTSLIVFIILPFILSAQPHSLLKDIGPDGAHGIPTKNRSTVWNDKTYFISVGSTAFGNQIWSTDGTSANTVQILTSGYPDMNFLTSINNGLIFNAQLSKHRELFVSDGTQAGTHSLGEFPSEQITFLEQLNDSTAIFVTQTFFSEITTIWSTDGTTEGTINLGQYDVIVDLMRFSFYQNNMILSEKSTSSSFFSPVITDGTVEGTMLVSDFINNAVADDISEAVTAVGTTDLIFLNTETEGLVFDGSTLADFPLTGGYHHGFKLGHLYTVFGRFNVGIYNSQNETYAELPIELAYFSEPIAHNSKAYFHDDFMYVYETDGTAANTKQVSAVSAGALSLDPYLFATGKSLIYNVVEDNKVELRILHLETGIDSLFSLIKPSGSSNFDPNIFSVDGLIVYTRFTTEAGREYWVYDPLLTGVRDLLNANQISLSPNPAENELNISFGDEMPANSSLSIYNTTGQILWSTPISADRQVVDITGFTPGQYFIQLQTNKGSQYGGTFVKK